jgi:cobalt-zinc-cadmium efflux system membrane fusion protein
MKKQNVTRLLKTIGVVVLGLAILAAVSAAAMPRVKDWISSKKDEGLTEKHSSSVALVKDHPNTLTFVVPEAAKQLQIQTAKVEKPRPGVLELNGSLGPDTDRLLPVRSRFPGEVMELGQVPDHTQGGITKFRDVGNGDYVEKDQLLAVVWSKDLGLTKSSLLGAISKLRLDEDILKRAEAKAEAVPEVFLLNARQTVESDRIALNAAELTLRSWRLTDQEIEKIRQEAEQLADQIAKGQKPKDDPRTSKDWARVEVRAPFSGTIVEKNFAAGAIVDTSTNLFIISDLSQLTVWANVFEEDLPTLQSLSRPIHWTVTLKNDPKVPPLKGTVQEIRPIIDPTQHSALVKGRIANPQGRMLSGQFITAAVKLPAPANQVAIPINALVEDGQDSIVFTQPNENELRYTMRKVAVAKRGRDWIALRTRLTDAEKKAGIEALHPGELVVTSGALELKAALGDLQERKQAAEKK